MHHDVYGAANNVVPHTNALAGTGATHTAPSSRDSLDSRQEPRTPTIARGSSNSTLPQGTKTLMMCLRATVWAAEPRGERRNRDVYTRYATQDRPPYGGHSQTATHDDDDAALLCRKRTRNRFAHHATYDADPIPRTNLIGLCPRPSPFTGAALSPCLSHIQQPITLRCGRQHIATGNTAHASPERYMRHPLS